MTTRFRILVLAAAVATLASAGPHASPILIEFTATGFTNLIDATPPPADPVSGAIVYNAASTTAPIDSLASISLSIAGHTYLLDEVGFIPDPAIGLVGGTIDGVGGSGNFEDDFLLLWELATGTPLLFLYASAGLSGIWLTSTFPEFSVSVVPVPEPNSSALVALALLALLAARTFRSTRAIGALWGSSRRRRHAGA